MYSKLLMTELDANKFILLPFLAIVIFFFIYLGIGEQETEEFMMASMITFWASLIVAASKAGHEKRDRQYMQLPVSASEVFLACWTYVLALLAILLLGWVGYGLTYGETGFFSVLAEALKLGLGVAVITAVVSIGIDLGAVRPAYLQWIYIGSVVLLLAIAVQLDVSVGVIGNDEEGIQIFPLALLDNSALEITIGVALFAVLFLADYLIYRNSDSFIG